MQDYLLRFIELSMTLESVSGDVGLSNFINGLKPKIRIEVRISKPRSLAQAMELAQKIEENL